MNVLRFALFLALACPLATRAAEYPSLLAADKPAAHWSFETTDGLTVHGKAATDAAGPRPDALPDFPPANKAASFHGQGSFISVKDPGVGSPLDFQLGDTITIEAWVSCRAIKDGQQVYIVGKGRTQNPGFAAHNQNWALRLRGQEGGASVSFLFRNERNRPDKGDEDWHRWTSTGGFAPGSGWRHVVVSYKFGDPDSLHGYLDGAPVEGSWDMGGKTKLGPVVDDDDVWIGSSMGGTANSTFDGMIDEVAVYRHALTPERVKLHCRRAAHAPAAKVAVKKPAVAPSTEAADPVPPPHIELAALPQGAVGIEILEHAGRWDPSPAETAGGNDSDPPKEEVGLVPSWATPPTVKTDEYLEPAFAFAEITHKYNARGVKVDRSRPFLVRASAAITLPAGEHQLLLRSLASARLALDGEQLAITEHLTRRSGDNEPVPDQAQKQLVRGLRLLPAGHHEALVKVQSDGKPHVISVEAFVGGKSIRPELGELSVSVSLQGAPFRVLTPAAISADLTDEGWTSLAEPQRERIAKLNRERRRQPAEEAYWALRHQLAREHARPAVPVPKVDGEKDQRPNPIDAFIAQRLQRPGVVAGPLTDDAAFLRRVTLDTIGVIPAPEEVSSFVANPSADKRARAIDRLLGDERWADRWVPYWQDVLAENPNMLKGTLNNTGPFRWWLHESLADNKPMDRFAAELIAMEGSAQYGGPAGFGTATQNDLPMAAKAQIVASAFLAKEMKCARCHDAPNHPFDQKDLFNLAAMMQRAPLKVPGTSLTKGLSTNSHVTVSLKAGQQIEPHWPFADVRSEPLPNVLRRPGDSRELLAAVLTDPRDERFAQVLVNRLWKELLGFGIVDPVDDWEEATPSHPELLRWLGHEFTTHGYDWKHVARIILNSQTYQRAATAAASRVVKNHERVFAAPARRRMTAEQLVDSLFAAAGKPIESELLTMDPEGRQEANDQGNLGRPKRAWEFAALSNERDRPALAKPHAQVVTDVLASFGWRESRPEPRSTRDHDPNVLQPALLANGTLGSRIVRLSDDSAFTAAALQEQALPELITQVFARILSRPPNTEEMRTFTELLAPGFEERLTGAPPAPKRQPVTKAVSWANHLNPEATTVVLDIEKQVKAGDAPTPRLEAGWRERLEDMLWALLLSPEFIHLP